MSNSSLFAILIGGLLVNNFVLSQFLGICPFLGVSKKLSQAAGMSAAVIFVMLLATAVTWPIQPYILEPNDLGYLQTQEYSMAEEGFTTTCLLPAVRDFYEDICRKNYYQKYPVIAVLFSTATPFWVMVFICALLVLNNKARSLQLVS